MVYEYGRIPTYKNAEEVSRDYVAQKGEILLILDTVSTMSIPDWQPTPSEKDFADTFSRTLREKGAQIIYIKVTREMLARKSETHTTYQYTVEKCVIKADPFIVDDWLIALAILTLAGIILTIIVRPSILKLTGVSPIEALGYDVGSIGLILAFAVLVFVVLLALPRRKKN